MRLNWRWQTFKWRGVAQIVCGMKAAAVDTFRAMLAAFRQINEEQRQAIMSPMVRMLGASVEELPNHKHVSLALDHLAAETKVGQFQWSTAVNPHSIPSLIRLPGVGWGIVYAKGDSGRWLIDLPDGVLKTGLFPRGTQFAPLHSLAVQEEGGESALSLFR